MAHYDTHNSFGGKIRAGCDMGDMTKEPSMEEILSSIKRIIAEEGDERTSAAPRRERRASAARKVALADVVGEEAVGEIDMAPAQDDEILELTESVAASGPSEGDMNDYVDAIAAAGQPATAPAAPSGATLAHDARRAPSAPAVTLEAPAVTLETIVSQESEAAARSSLAALTSAIDKPHAAPAETSLEGLVRELLRPMLKDWLDQNLPHMVEGMVAKEIARITGRAL